MGPHAGHAHPHAGHPHTAHPHTASLAAAAASPFYAQNVAMMSSWRAYDSAGFQRASPYGEFVCFYSLLFILKHYMEVSHFFFKFIISFFQLITK